MWEELFLQPLWELIAEVDREDQTQEALVDLCQPLRREEDPLSPSEKEDQDPRVESRVHHHQEDSIDWTPRNELLFK